MTWQAVFSEAERRVWKVVSATLSDAVFSEGQIAQAVIDALPADSTLVIGNSLPVRDLDLFCRPSAKSLRVLHQRGASGIDGLIAGAAGARSLLDRPLAVLLGDLSALHDVGGLGMLRAVSGPLAVVVVQNGGGRIFEQLPIGSNSVAHPYFESLFLTAQGVDFSHAAAAFAIPYQRVSDLSTLQSALLQAMSSDRPLLIEAVVPGEDGVKRRKRIYGQLATELAQSDGGLGASIATPTETLPSVFWHGFLGSPTLWQPIAQRLGVPIQMTIFPVMDRPRGCFLMPTFSRWSMRWWHRFPLRDLRCMAIRLALVWRSLRHSGIPTGYRRSRW